MIKLFRAFLSHSSRDKPLVGTVAEHLGRAAVIYDVFEFEAGRDFKEAIIRGLGRSEFFVLFASRDALSSDWVKLEIDKAEEASASQALSQVVTYIIDPDLPLDDVPDWMKSTLIVRRNEPGLIALDIRRILGEKVHARIPSYFVGRQNELDQSLREIASFTDPDYRPPLLVYGLTGIGRRSLVSAIGRDHLSFPKLFIIDLKQGDLLPELLLKVTSRLSLDAASDPASFLEAQSEKDAPSLVGEIIELFESICSSGALPVVVERDAISLPSGILRPDFDLLYNAIATNPVVDAAIVSNRRLHGSGGGNLASVRVPELPPAATQNLIRLMGRDRGLPFDNAQVEALSVYCRGYPPAVQFALDEARAYGVPHVVANQKALVNFSAEIFLKQIKADKKISSTMSEIMKLLSSYSPLPMTVIVNYCSVEIEQLIEEIEYLLDFAFVLPEGPHYRISEPIRDAAYRAFGGMFVDHGRVAQLLEEYLTNEPDDDARLALSQTIFRASLLSDSEKHSPFAVGFASDFIQVATQSYHDQDYDLAIKYGKAAIDLRPDNVDLRRYVAQALIRKERYTEAETHIDALVEVGELKEAFYVKGFAARRQRNYAEAIEAYKKSLAYGRGGAAVHRELASCYFEMGDLPKAERHIREAESKSPHNKFIVDLRCTIAIRLGDLESAERTLEILDRVEMGGFAEHRHSTFEQARGDPKRALSFAQSAIAKMSRPPFEVVANVANCEIEAAHPEEAMETLTLLGKRFGKTHHNAQVGLRCKYEIRFGEISNAEGLWNSLNDKETPVHNGLRLAILNRKLQADSLDDAEARELQALSEKQDQADSQRLAHMLGSLFSISE